MTFQTIRQGFDKHPEYKYIFWLFLATRIVLTAVGTLARALIKSPHNFVYSKYIWLAIWGVWDSGWYLPLAKYGYSAVISSSAATIGQANYAFFPLYPLLISLFEKIIGNYFIAGLLVANISLIVACVYLYKLARLDFDRAVSLRTIQYCLLWPVAFIFSGVFTESLYLALAIAAFYYARKNNWLLACILGFFLALTRSIGALIVIPLLYEYLRTKSVSISSLPRNLLTADDNRSLYSLGCTRSVGMETSNIGKEMFYFLLVPAGLGLFSYYNYILTKNPFAFLQIQASWGRQLVNPIRLIIGGLFHGDITSIFNSLFVLLTVALVIIFYKKIRGSYLIFIAYSIIVPLLTGLESLPRYILVIFPLFILLAQITKNKFVNYSLSATLFLAQCALMVFWTTGFNLVK
jgi:hypothetical protein